MKKVVSIIMLVLLAVSLMAKENQDCYQMAEQKANQIIAEQKRMQQSVDMQVVKIKWDFVARQFKGNQMLDDLINFNKEMGRENINLGKVKVKYHWHTGNEREVFGFRSDPSQQKVHKHNYKRFIALSKIDTLNFLINVSKQHAALLNKIEKARKNWQSLHDYLTEKNLLNYLSVESYYERDTTKRSRSYRFIFCTDSKLSICGFETPPTLEGTLHIVKDVFGRNYFQALVDWDDHTRFKQQLEKEVCEFIVKK